MANSEKKDSIFSRIISEKEKRKLRALEEQKRSEWFGFGMFGMVGWTVTATTFLGTMGGIWLDKNYHQTFSWTLTCLILGLVIGCIVAWNWVIKENKEKKY